VSFERRLTPGRGSRLGSLGTAGLILLGLLVAGAWAVWHLRLGMREMWPGPSGWQVAADFLSRSWRPAWHYEGSYQQSGGWGLPLQSLRAAGQTVVFAASALSLAVIGGLGLGALGSLSLMRHPALRPVVVAARLVSNVLRSVHELIWAVLLLAGLGYGELVAVVAIALPYTGALARIFAEITDEVPDDAAQALAMSGATAAQRFVFGVLPRAVPEMIAYT